MSPPLRVLAFKSMRRNSLLGFVSIQFPSGMIMHEIAVLKAGSKIWCSPPSRAWLDGDAVVRDEITNKTKYSPLVEFSTHGVRSTWSRQIVTAMRQQHPEVLEEQEDAMA